MGEALVAEADGILQVGEVPVVIRRDSSVEENHDQAYRSGAENAYRRTLVYVEDRIRMAGRYDDVRPLQDLVVWLTDSIQGTTPD